MFKQNQLKHTVSYECDVKCLIVIMLYSNFVVKIINLVEQHSLVSNMDLDLDLDVGVDVDVDL